jgi:hypothetical protein
MIKIGFLIALLSSPAYAEVCKRCGRVHAVKQVSTIEAKAQAWAQREAEIMASRGRCGHFLGCAPGSRFSGVGMSSSPQPSTCVPWRYGSSARILIADAIVYRNGRYYRSRHWR